jgi:hypothetical protein
MLQTQTDPPPESDTTPVTRPSKVNKVQVETIRAAIENRDSIGQFLSVALC